MKTRITPLKRVLAFLLIIATICAVFASCATDANLESDSDTDNGSYAEGGENGVDGIESDDSIIPIFSNGAYTAKIIRGDMASTFEKDVYNQIRELFKEKTDVNPEFATDFVAAGEERYDGPAILIGETSYEESKAAYKKLPNDQATATLSGNKYVIAFSSASAVENLIKTLKTNLSKKATKEEITIDSSWKITAKVDVVSSGNETFDDTGLIKSATLPSLGTSYNSGQGSKTYIKNNANKAAFETLCKEIEAKGLKKYTTNSIGNNLFATYVTQTQIVHVMFFPNKNQIRTAVDKRGEGSNGFALPGLSGENKYKKSTDSEMIVCDISNGDWPGGMCIIFKLADGRFFIVDAGIGGKLSDNRKWIGSSSGWIYATLAKHAADPKNIEVAAWLITHPHSDHAGGLYDMALGYHGATNAGKHTVMPKEIKQYIKIDKLIYNAPDNLPDCNREGWIPEIIKQFKIKNVVKAHAGQVFYFADLKFTIYGSLDIMIEDSSKCGDTNEYSLSIKTEFNGKTALLLGDSDKIPNKQLAIIYKEQLKADILQLAHHGYGDTGDADVNSYCNPSMVLWVVSNVDLKKNYAINVNTSIASLKGVKNYKPGTGNLIFRKDYSTYSESFETIVKLIPTCDGTYCGNKNCTKKSSTRNSFN